MNKDFKKATAHIAAAIEKNRQELFEKFPSLIRVHSYAYDTHITFTMGVRDVSDIQQDIVDDLPQRFPDIPTMIIPSNLPPSCWPIHRLKSMREPQVRAIENINSFGIRTDQDGAYFHVGTLDLAALEKVKALFPEVRIHHEPVGPVNAQEKAQGTPSAEI